jgi:hypothetical protein
VTSRVVRAVVAAVLMFAVSGCDEPRRPSGVVTGSEWGEGSVRPPYVHPWLLRVDDGVRAVWVDVPGHVFKACPLGAVFPGCAEDGLGSR